MWSLSGTAAAAAPRNLERSQLTQSPVEIRSPYANYTALPARQPNTVTVTVTPQADPRKRRRPITIVQGAGLSISPATATLAGNQRITLPHP